MNGVAETLSKLNVTPENLKIMNVLRDSLTRKMNEAVDDLQIQLNGAGKSRKQIDGNIRTLERFKAALDAFAGKVQLAEKQFLGLAPKPLDLDAIASVDNQSNLVSTQSHQSNVAHHQASLQNQKNNTTNNVHFR